MTGLVSDNEAERLQKLHSLAVLDTGTDPVLDAIVEVACIASGMPIGLIILLDADRQWFKASRGLNGSTLQGDDAFCRHTILGDTLFIVPDASKDDRFSEISFVAGEEHIRFYAGHPIEVEPGIRIGSLCVLDRVPRQIDSNVKLILERLARCVAERLRNSENGRLLQFLSAERRNQAKASLALIRAAETALSQKAFLLYYQPKFELQTGQRVGFEALLRWQHSDNSVLAPAAFAEILDHPGLSRRIGSYVLRSAVAQAKVWERAGVDFGHIAINVSSSQFAEVAEGKGLVEELLAVVEEAKLNPDKLQIEITEGVVLSSDAGHVAQKLEQLRAAGFTIAFDDFGTGFASLVHLKDLQYDQIKIDGSFVRAMTHSPTDRVIVKAIIDLAQSLGKEVVAEGIETEAEFEALRQFGCRYGQGYLFGRPNPPSNVE